MGSPLTPYGTAPVIPEELLRNYGGSIFESYVKARLAIAQRELIELDEDLNEAPDDVVSNVT